MSPPTKASGTRPAFVRSWDTDVTVQRSGVALEEMLRRYGVSGYTRSEDYEQKRIVVAFTIAGRDIRILVDVNQVKRKLLQVPDFARAVQAKPSANRETWTTAQSERVAWRHLVLYVEAGLNAVSAGLLTLEEAFFAHAMLNAPDGAKYRAIDVATAAEQMGRLGAGSGGARAD